MTILSYLNLQKQWNNADDIQHVADDLSKNENAVTTLHLTGNTMGITAAEHLVEPLSKQSKIEKLLFSDLFTGRGKDEIGVALKALSLGLMNANVHLVELDLSDNAFGPNGVVGVTELISSPCCYTLKVLNMNNQGLGHQGCRALVKAMKTSRENSNKQGLNLEVFIAGRNRLENEGMEMLSEVFGDGMKSLQKLVLLQNGIGVYGIRGVENLIVAIRNHTNMRILNISDNNIKANGMNLLSNVIPEFEKLEELHMDDCLLGKKGANMFTLLAEDRAICPDLKIISLSGNEMRSAAAISLVNAIVEGKPSIERIDLRENEIRKQSLNEMVDILRSFGKEDILVREEETSDDEEVIDDDNSEDESEDSEEESQNSDEEFVNDEDDSNNSDLDDEETSEEQNGVEDGDNLSEDSTEDRTKNSNPKETSSITTFPASTASTFVFGKKPESKNIFGTPTKPANINENPYNTRTNLFSNAAKTSSNIFTAGEISSIKHNSSEGNLFSFSEAAKTTSGLFGTKAAPATGLFGTQAAPTTGLFGTQAAPTTGLFGTQAAPMTGLFGTKAAPTTGLFGTKAAPTTGLFGTQVAPFSFTLAAKPDTSTEQLTNAIKSCLQSPSLMSIERAALKVPQLGSISATIDQQLRSLLERNVANGVRVALILCEDQTTFDLGLSLIGDLLSSTATWAHAINAVLVEMDCIKSEEKKFVGLCGQSDGRSVAIGVLRRLLATDRLTDEIKSIVGATIKNLSKMASKDSDDLLAELGDVMNRLSI